MVSRVSEECFARLLRSCDGAGLLGEGKRIHLQITDAGGPTRFLGNLLVQMYGKCGSLDDARAAFAAIPDPNLFSWSLLLTACIQNRDLRQARQLFDTMPQRDCVAWNAMITAYADADQGERAQAVLDRMPRHNVLSWTSALQGHANVGNLAEARRLFQWMPARTCVSWTWMIQATSQIGRLEDAEVLFRKMPARTILPWNFLLAAYAQNGHLAAVEALWREMPERDLKSQTLLLSRYAQLGRIDSAQQVFDSMESRDVVACNAMVAAFAHCGDVGRARKVFDDIKAEDRSDVSWLAMIQGYAQNGMLRDAREVLESMPRKSVAARNALIAAYGGKGDLARAKEAFDSMAAEEQDVVSWTALMASYAQGGRLDEAVALFREMPWRDVAAWNAMVAALAHCGRGKESVAVFSEMILEGLHPDEMSFISALTGCSRGGLLKTGRELFHAMVADFAIAPWKDHYCCMADVLGRSGELKDAEDLIRAMPFLPDAVTWMTLLGACKNHRDAEVGARVAERLTKMDAANPTPYVLLAGLYTSLGRHDEANAVRKTMEENCRSWKIPGVSVIEIEERQHRFVAGDTTHPRSNEILAELERLRAEMEEEGYNPATEEVLHDVGEEEKGKVLMHHSEKLAIALGMISTPDGDTLRIVKNLRVCSDCHTAIKIISKVSRRQIVVRDASRFHYFEKGRCSCQDYW